MLARFLCTHCFETSHIEQNGQGSHFHRLYENVKCPGQFELNPKSQIEDSLVPLLAEVQATIQTIKTQTVNSTQNLINARRSLDELTNWWNPRNWGSKSSVDARLILRLHAKSVRKLNQYRHAQLEVLLKEISEIEDQITSMTGLCNGINLAKFEMEGEYGNWLKRDRTRHKKTPAAEWTKSELTLDSIDLERQLTCNECGDSTVRAEMASAKSRDLYRLSVHSSLTCRNSGQILKTGDLIAIKETVGSASHNPVSSDSETYIVDSVYGYRPITDADEIRKLPYKRQKDY